MTMPSAATTGLAGSHLRILSRLLPAVAAACLLRALLLVASWLLAQPAPATFSSITERPPAPASLAPPLDPDLALAIAPAAGPAVSDDPPLDPKALLEVANDLKQQRERMERRERDLETREVALRVVESRLAAQIDQLEGLKSELEGLLGKLSAEEQQRVERLVKVYEAMKPAKAAAIFNAMDLMLLAPVVKRMREAKVAAIIEDMDPSKARALTLELGRAKDLPVLVAPAIPAPPPPAPGRPPAPSDPVPEASAR